MVHKIVAEWFRMPGRTFPGQDTFQAGTWDHREEEEACGFCLEYTPPMASI